MDLPTDIGRMARSHRTTDVMIALDDCMHCLSIISRARNARPQKPRKESICKLQGAEDARSMHRVLVFVL